MGLMTNPKAQAVVAKYILKFYIPLSVLLYVAAIAVMIGLAVRPFNAGCYFSENALLPGLVQSEYDGTTDVAKYSDLVEENVVDTGVIPHEFLKGQFTEIGLEAFVQNFTVDHPFLHENETITGANVYAVLRAPRIAGTEAMVFMTPLRVKALDGTMTTNKGIGLMFSLAKHFAQKTYWSKDIIFLVVDKEEIGVQAWIEAYHDIKREHIRSSPLHGRSGAILAAISLELPRKSVDHMDMRIEGLNGQLPNLDLFNLAVRLCMKERVPPTFQNRRDPALPRLLTPDGIRYTTETMLSNMLHQASGQSNGVHGLLLRYGIQAVTLHGVESYARGDKMRQIGLIVEGMFRSVNNILERFHQSFFFYVLPQVDRYVSIGMYMISLGMLLVIPTANGLALWFQTAEDPDKKGKFGCSEGRPHYTVLPVVIGCHIAGILLYLSPEVFVSQFCDYFGLGELQALKVGLGAFFSGCLLIPLQLKPVEHSDWMLLKCYGLVWQAITLLAISMTNFSLAFFISIFTIPVYGLTVPYQNVLLRLVNKGALLLVSPPAIVAILVLFYAVNFNDKELTLETLQKSFMTSIDSIADSVIQQYLFDNWSFALGSLVLFPSWFLMWICSSR